MDAIDTNSKAVSQTRDMTVGSIPRHIIAFSIPMLAGNFIELAHNIINSIWIGRGLGKIELGALAASFPPIFLIVAICVGLSIGGNILVSQFFGAKDFKKLDKVVQSSTIIIIFSSIILFLLGEMFAPWVVKVLNTPENVIPSATSYLRVYLFTIPFIFLVNNTSALLRGVGNSKIPLYFLSAGLIINILLDPLLIFGFLGFPKLGLEGAALATVISKALCLVALLYYLQKTKSIIDISFKKLKLDWPMTWLILKIGVPSVVQQSLVSLSMVVVITLVNGFGENAIATYGSVTRIDNLALLPALTIGASVSTIAAQNIGAQKIKRVKKIFLWSLFLSGAITIFVSLCAIIFPRTLIKMFTTDGAVLTMGANYLKIVAPFYVCFAIQFVANGILNGAGLTFLTTIISLVSLCGTRIPLAVYFSRKMNSITGIWYAVAISFVISMLLSLILYLSGCWRRSNLASKTKESPQI